MAGSMNRGNRMSARAKYGCVLGCLGLPIAIALATAIGIYAFLKSEEAAYEREMESIRAKGEPTNGEELDAWYAYPEGKNYADVVMAAAQAYTALPAMDVFVGGESDGPVDQDERLEAAHEIVAANAETLALLRLLPLDAPARYPIDLSRGMDTELPHLAPIRGCARLLYADAVCKAANNDVEGATDNLVRMTALAETLRNEPILISQLVRVNITTFLFDTAEEILSDHALSASQLEKLSVALEHALVWDNVLLRSFVGERAILFTSLENGGPEFEDIGDVGEDFADTRIAEFALGAAGSARSRRIVAQHFRTLIDAARLKEPHAEAAFQDFFASMDEIAEKHVLVLLLNPGHLVGTSVLTNLSRARITFLQREGMLYVMMVAIAVEQYWYEHGEPPGSISDLAPTYLESLPLDPGDRKPIRYTPLEDGYRVHGVGDNGTDELGKVDHPIEGDIVFEVRRGEGGGS